MRELPWSRRPSSETKVVRPPAARAGGPAAGLLALQRRAGNRAVSRLLARQPVTSPALPPMPLTNDPLRGTTSGDLGPPLQHATLRWGTQGVEVEFLQGRLNQDGAVPALTVDGDFRSLTRAAVLELQRRHGLLVDGIVGPQTWGMIDELARAGIAGPHDVMADTAAVTQAEATAISQHLGTALPSGPAAVVAGYEPAVLAALDAYYDRELSRLLSQDITTIAHAGRLRDIAQRLVDDYYSDHIVMASREGELRSLHPGSFVLPVGDAATRPVDDGFAKAWVKLDMLPEQPDATDPRPSDVSHAHHVDTRRQADERLVDRVADVYLRQPGRLDKVRRYIRAYPAEVSSGTAYLGLRSRDWLARDVTTPGAADLRRAMWDMLSGLIHEYLHKVAHTHFSDTAEQIGGDARRVLIEGFCDYFRKQLWDDLMPRFQSDSALRAEVEGRYGRAPDGTQLPVDADVIVPHDYYDQLADATAIVRELGEGDRAEANARAAYFMGHVELLGIGPTTRGEHAAGRLGTWNPADAADDDLYVVPRGGERVSDIWDRTGSTAVQAEATGLFFGPAAAGTVLRGGSRLRVRGIRHLRATQSDTRAQVAVQNGITQRALERANHWAPAPGDTRIPLGVRILIPAH